MTEVLGLRLEEALIRLTAEHICPEIVHTAGFHPAALGHERVIRVSADGKRLIVARFPDAAGIGKEEA